MSIYASSLTAPHTIRWADRPSPDGTDDGVRAGYIHTRIWDAAANACPYGQAYLYFHGSNNQYQVQYRTRKRMVYSADGADNLDGKWEAFDDGTPKWSAWSDSEFDCDPATQETTDANAWNFANCTSAHLDQPYITLARAFEFGTNPLTVFDAVRYHFRVRAFRTSDKRHGDWAETTLTVAYAPGIAFTQAILGDDGSLLLEYDTPWTRNDGRLRFENVARGAENVLVTRGYTIDGILGKIAKTDTSVIVLPAYQMSSDLDVGRTITLAATYFSTDGTDGGAEYAVPAHTLTVRSKYSGTDTSKPIIDVSEDFRKILTITATKEPDSYAWASSTVRLKWTDDTGDVQYLYPDSKVNTYNGNPSSGNHDKTVATFRTPPLDVEISAQCWIKSEDTEMLNTTLSSSKVISVPSGGLAVFRTPTHTACIYYNPESSESFTPEFESEKPAGRSRPIRRYGIGGTKSITISGDVSDKRHRFDDGWQATVAAWKTMERKANKNGVLCLPGGVRYVCGIDSITTSDSYESVATGVTVSFSEVS